MNNNFLAFLNNVTLTEANIAAKKSLTGTKQRTPDEDKLALRLWYTGAIYPSKSLVEKFNLEYVGRNVKTEPTEDPSKPRVTFSPKEKSNGLDIFVSDDWFQIPKKGPDGNPLPGYQNILLMVPADRGENAKLSLFSKVAFDDNNEPKSSVLDQGSETFGKEYLLEKVQELFQITLEKDGKEYVDLEMVEGFNLANLLTNKIAIAPKVVSKGEKKGTVTYEYRHNVETIAVLMPIQEETETAPTSDVDPFMSDEEGFTTSADEVVAEEIAEAGLLEVEENDETSSEPDTEEGSEDEVDPFS